MLRFVMGALMAMVGTTNRESMNGGGETGGRAPSSEKEDNRRNKPVWD